MMQVHLANVKLKATSGLVIVTIAMAALLIISQFFLLDKITQPLIEGWQMDYKERMHYRTCKKYNCIQKTDYQICNMISVLTFLTHVLMVFDLRLPPSFSTSSSPTLQRRWACSKILLAPLSFKNQYFVFAFFLHRFLIHNLYYVVLV